MLFEKRRQTFLKTASVQAYCSTLSATITWE
jgi:hypothetical protein